MDESFHAAGGLPPIVIFIRRMIAVLRETETQKENRRVPRPLHRLNEGDDLFSVHGAVDYSSHHSPAIRITAITGSIAFNDTDGNTA